MKLVKSKIIGINVKDLESNGTEKVSQYLIGNKQKNQLYMDLEKKGDWDKDWVALWVFYIFYSFHFIKQTFAYPYTYVCI